MVFVSLAVVAASCTSRHDGVEARRAANEIRVLLDSPPATLEPRQALDAQGQRLNMLLFRAVTRLDEKLRIQPDLATRWWTEEAGRRWVFEIAEGAPGAAKVAACIREYLAGEKPSPLRSSFPNFRAVSHRENRVSVELTSPDPYFPRNASLFRYFEEEGVETPCAPIVNDAKVRAFGNYEMRPFERRPEREIVLHSRSDPSAPTLRFQVVRDETARLQKFLSDEADVAPNAFTSSKWLWFKANHPARFDFLMQDGVNVSYIAFHSRDPALGRAEVRRAIAHAIDIGRITRHKFPENTYPAGSFLSSHIPGSVQTFREFSPARSEALLDAAGYRRGPDGVRLRLRYKTTTSRDGFDTALLFQDMLRKVGIELELEVVEIAVFFSSIRKGNFQMYSSRWIGVSDASIFYRTLSRESADNRLKYSDPEMNAWLEAAKSELNEERRNELVRKIQLKMAEEVPYYPLWFWTNSLIKRREIVGLESSQLSLSGSYLPLQSLRWKK